MATHHVGAIRFGGDAHCLGDAVTTGELDRADNDTHTRSSNPTAAYTTPNRTTTHTTPDQPTDRHACAGKPYRYSDACRQHAYRDSHTV